MENLLKKKPKFGAYEGVVVYIIAIIASMCIQFFAAIVIGVLAVAGNEEAALSPTLNLVFMIFIQASFCFVYYHFVIKRRQTLAFSPVLYKETKQRLSLLLCVGLAVASLCAFYPLAMFFAMFLEYTGFKGSVAIEFVTPFDHVLAVLVVVILAPIFEELIFRGALLSGLKSKMSVHKAVLLSALAFMLMHMNPEQTVYQFLLGVVMGYAAVYTKTVLAPIIIHAASNLIAYLLEATALGNAVGGFIETLAQNPVVGVIVAIAFIIGFSAVILGILIFMKKLNKDVLDVEVEYEKAKDEPTPSLEVVFDIRENANKEETSNNDVNIQDEAIQKPKQTTKKRAPKKDFKTLYIIAIGLCIFMWLTVLVGGYVDLESLYPEDDTILQSITRTA